MILTCGSAALSAPLPPVWSKSQWVLTAQRTIPGSIPALSR